MIKVYGLLCILAFVASFAGSCSPGDSYTPDNSPASETPVSWDEQSDSNWIHRSQYKTNMRHMWVDANRIVSSGSGDMVPNWAEVQTFSSDIRWRAENYSKHWQDLLDETEAGLFAVEDEDRIELSGQVDAIGITCDSCHTASWSPWYLRVNEGILDKWKQDVNTPNMVADDDPNPPPQIHHRKEMHVLCDLEIEIRRARDEWDLPAMESSLQSIKQIAAARAALWRTVVTESNTIEVLARAKKSEGMKEAYGRMRNACITCHAMQVGEVREVHNPISWD